MGMRITTSMMMNTYRYNLQGSTKNLSDARESVLTQRKFSSYMEDPSAATQAWRIRRAMSSNFDYQANNDDTYSRFSVAWTSMGMINHDLSDLDGRFSTIRGENGAIGAGRQPLGQVLNETAKSIVQTMNSAKYGDHFVFSGDDEMNPPFSWDNDKLLYRGVNVGAGAEKAPSTPPKWADPVNLNEKGLPEGMPTSAKTEWEQAWINYYIDQAELAQSEDGTLADGRDPAPDPSTFTTDPYANLPAEDFDQFGIPKTIKEDLESDDPATRLWAAYYKDQGDVKKLDYLAKEEQNVDLGMGLKEDADGILINGTAFDRSLPGINMLGGYGVDEDGDPKNIVLILQRIGELFSNSDPNSGEWAEPGDEAEAMRLLDKLNDAHHKTTEAYTEIETRAHFLTQNQTRLESQGDDLQTERLNLEQVDLADAITEFSWDYYCYRAALKVGTELLGQSLIDYMR